MKKSGYCAEAFILGIFIMCGLFSIDVNVHVNVTDKPIISNHKNAEVKNITRDD